MERANERDWKSQQMRLAKLSSAKQLSIRDILLSPITYDVEIPVPQDPPYVSWYRDREHSGVVLGSAELRDDEEYEDICSATVTEAESCGRVTMRERAYDTVCSVYDSRDLGDESTFQLLPDEADGRPLIRVVPEQRARSLLLESIKS
jgi:hypothetical protein